MLVENVSHSKQGQYNINLPDINKITDKFLQLYYIKITHYLYIIFIFIFF